MPLVGRAPCSHTDPLRVAVLVSGAGTNLRALLNYARETPDCRYQIVRVVSNRKDAGAVRVAQSAGVAVDVVEHGRWPSRQDFERHLVDDFAVYGVELVVLAGFMRVLTSTMCSAFRGCIVNVHPSLLPAFPGRRAIADALDANAQVTGCSIHVVDERVDGGPVIASHTVPVLAGDTESSLRKRIQRAEHRLYPRCIDALAHGTVVVDDRLRPSRAWLLPVDDVV